MSDRPRADDEPEDEPEDASASMVTGVRDQVLVIDGWFASHADSGTPGPHVRLWARGRNGPVLKTSQVPELVERLQVVAERIDRMWKRDGAEHDVSDAPDDNDPDVIRQRRVDELVLAQRFRTHAAEVIEILLSSDNRHDASKALAPLLGIDEDEVAYRLTVDLFDLTRRASEAGTDELAGLRAEV